MFQIYTYNNIRNIAKKSTYQIMKQSIRYGDAWPDK
jgi:hypothetical protein